VSKERVMMSETTPGSDFDVGESETEAVIGAHANDTTDEPEWEEILLPNSMREGVDDVVEALRNLVRTQPLLMVGIAAGTAYLAGRLGRRR
jgi:hypothetical protein